MGKRKIYLCKWSEKGSDFIAALLIYISLIKECNEEGKISLTYKFFEDNINLSRAKIASGIKLLENKLEIIDINRDYRNSIYTIKNYEPFHWGKVPVQNFYNTCLSFKLRSMDELHALMLYIIIITYRNNVTNFTEISYTKIADIAKMNRNHIRSAISKLVAINLIHVDRKQESHSCSMYRLIGINDYINKPPV